jgi:hypothetical protein
VSGPDQRAGCGTAAAAPGDPGDPVATGFTLGM